MIEKGTKLLNERNEEVEVNKIWIENYPLSNNYKVIIQTKDKYNCLNEYWLGDLGRRIKLLKENNNEDN